MNQEQTTSTPNRLLYLLDIRTPLYILNITAVVAAVLLLLFAYLPNLGQSAIAAVFAVLILISSTASLLFTYRGRPEIAAFIFNSIIYMGTISIGLTYSGLQSPSVFPLLILIIPLSSLYFSRRQTIIVLGILLLSTIGFQIGGSVSLLALEPLDPDDFIISLLALLLIAAIMEFTSNRLLNLLSSSQKNEAELEIANQELVEIRGSLEERIEDRTKSLSERNLYLEAITQIAHEANTIRDEEELLQRVVDLIGQRLNYYQVGIFIVDEHNEWAEMKAASSPGGKRMLARGHRLRVGKQGIVGYVTGIGRARIAQSTQMDRIHAVNPELPDTRAEMGLPLKAHGEIIGALDIQDSREQAFTHETIQVMQTLADQIALAIDNLRLYEQAEQSLIEAQRAYGEYSRQAWIEAQRSGDLPAYRLTKGTDTGAQKVDTDALPTLPEDRKFELPIQVRGQTIGILDIVKPGQDKEWSLEEQELLNSLSEQLGIALDSARLFNETQKRAATERLVADVSDQIRGTLDIDTIMKTATEQIRTVLNLPQVVIRLAEETQDPNGQHTDSAEAE